MFNAQFGKLTITADEPGATVVVDGKPAGQVPLTAPLSIDPGRHRVELQAGRSTFQEVRLKPGDAGTLHLVLSPDLRADPVTGWKPHRKTALTAALVVGGIGLAGVIAGGVLWGLDGLQSCPAAPLCPTALDSKTTGVGVLAGGLGLTVASAILLGVELRLNGVALHYSYSYDYDPNMMAVGEQGQVAWRLLDDDASRRVAIDPTIDEVDIALVDGRHISAILLPEQLARLVRQAEGCR